MWSFVRGDRAFHRLLQKLILPCAVLSNGVRVLSQRGLYGALGGSRSKGRGKGEDRVDDIPPFLAAKNLEPFISDDLRASASTPIRYRVEVVSDDGHKTTTMAHGIEATLIPDSGRSSPCSKVAAAMKP